MPFFGVLEPLGPYVVGIWGVRDLWLFKASGVRWCCEAKCFGAAEEKTGFGCTLMLRSCWGPQGGHGFRVPSPRGPEGLEGSCVNQERHSQGPPYVCSSPDLYVHDAIHNISRRICLLHRKHRKHLSLLSHTQPLQGFLHSKADPATVALQGPRLTVERCAVL